MERWPVLALLQKQSPRLACVPNPGTLWLPPLVPLPYPPKPRLIPLWLPLVKGLQGEKVLARGPGCCVHPAAVSPTVGLYLAVWDAPLSRGTG